MKKIMNLMAVILTITVLASSGLFAQDKQQTGQDKKKTKKFLTTWKKVGNKTKEIRSFKTEKATTVAGVRGAEAEDEALKHLYFKGGVKYPSRLELKNAITMLDMFVKENPEDESVPESKYFIAQCYFQLGEIDNAKTAYQDLIKDHPASEFAGYAEEELKEIMN